MTSGHWNNPFGNRWPWTSVCWSMSAVICRLVACTLALLLIGCSVEGTPGPSTPSRSGSPEVLPSPDPERPAFSLEPLDGNVLETTVRRNWHEGCPVPLSDLRVVTVKYVGFDGEVRSGPLVVNASVATDIEWVFRRLFRARFPIKHIALPRKWRPGRNGGYARTRSVTAAFNCRPVTDGTSFSQHSFGWAIDINPLQNPYVRGDGSVLRRAAKAFVDRSQDLPGMIHPGDIVVRSFARIGWEWGGAWTSLKDYMHFSATGT